MEASLAGCSGILMVRRLPCRRGKHAIRRRDLWHGTGGRCSGVEGDGVWGLMLSVGFKDCECVSERISWLINDWSLLD